MFKFNLFITKLLFYAMYDNVILKIEHYYKRKIEKTNDPWNLFLTILNLRYIAITLQLGINTLNTFLYAYYIFIFLLNDLCDLNELLIIMIIYSEFFKGAIYS